MNKEKLRKVEMFVVICLLLVGALTFFTQGGITGHVSSDLSTTEVDLLIPQSQVFELTTNSPESFYSFPATTLPFLSQPDWYDLQCLQEDLYRTSFRAFLHDR